jgi:hypothetical protein
MGERLVYEKEDHIVSVMGTIQLEIFYKRDTVSPVSGYPGGCWGKQGIRTVFWFRLKGN